MLGHFLFTLPHELAAGQRRRLRELGQAPYQRTFLFRYYREAYQGPGKLSNRSDRTQGVATDDVWTRSDLNAG